MKDTIIEIVKISEIERHDFVLIPDLEGAEVCMCQVERVSSEDGYLVAKGIKEIIKLETVVRVKSDKHPIRVQLIKTV